MALLMLVAPAAGGAPAGVGAGGPESTAASGANLKEAANRDGAGGATGESGSVTHSETAGESKTTDESAAGGEGGAHAESGPRGDSGARGESGASGESGGNGEGGNGEGGNGEGGNGGEKGAGGEGGRHSTGTNPGSHPNEVGPEQESGRPQGTTGGNGGPRLRRDQPITPTRVVPAVGNRVPSTQPASGTLATPSASGSAGTGGPAGTGATLVADASPSAGASAGGGQPGAVSPAPEANSAAGPPNALAQASQPASRRGPGGGGKRVGGHAPGSGRPGPGGARPAGSAPTGRAAAIGAVVGGVAGEVLGARAGGPRASARSAHPRRGRHAASVGGSPVARTVERIVGVVPQAVWMLIGALALLTAALAAGSGIAALRARRLARQRARLADDVGALQAALLPAVPERMAGVRTSVAYRPAEGPAAGGDFYDLFALGDGRIAVIVGDVSGHGRTALPQTALIRYTARAYLDSGLPPRAALNSAATSLEHQLGYDCFATAVLATYDPSRRTLTYSSAGHPPPLILGTEPLEPVVAAASPPIGLGLETGLRQTVVSLPGAARACFLTDGVLEARVGSELFGVDRLSAALAELGPGDSAEALLAQVVAGTDRRPDDMAACLLGLEGRPLAAQVRSEELVIDRVELSSERAARFLVACGLDPGQVKSALRHARTAVDQAGGAVLRLRFGDDGPRVEIEHARRAFAHTGHTRAGGAPLGSPLA